MIDTSDITGNVFDIAAKILYIAANALHRVIDTLNLVVNILHLAADSTFPSTLCVIFNSSADAICISSCVNLSNRSRLSSMSEFLVNFFIYFSK